MQGLTVRSLDKRGYSSPVHAVREHSPTQPHRSRKSFLFAGYLTQCGQLISEHSARGVEAQKPVTCRLCAPILGMQQ